MAEFEQDHPGQKEPRSHGHVHHEDRIVDLNTAPEEQIADLPMVGPERAKAICAARLLNSWEDVERIEGFGKDMIDDLKSGGAQIGGPG